MWCVLSWILFGIGVFAVFQLIKLPFTKPLKCPRCESVRILMIGGKMKYRCSRCGKRFV